MEKKSFRGDYAGRHTQVGLGVRADCATVGEESAHAGEKGEERHDEEIGFALQRRSSVTMGHSVGASTLLFAMNYPITLLSEGRAFDRGGCDAPGDSFHFEISLIFTRNEIFSFLTRFYSRA